MQMPSHLIPVAYVSIFSSGNCIRFMKCTDAPVIDFFTSNCSVNLASIMSYVASDNKTGFILLCRSVIIFTGKALIKISAIFLPLAHAFSICSELCAFHCSTNSLNASCLLSNYEHCDGAFSSSWPIVVFYKP